MTRPDKNSIIEIESEKEPISILMNEKRQKILQLIFKFPCIHLHEIARNFGFSINATRWHLRKLINFGYIDEYELGNKKVYFPSNTLEEKDIQILGLVNNKKFEGLFTEILQKPLPPQYSQSLYPLRKDALHSHFAIIFSSINNLNNFVIPL